MILVLLALVLSLQVKPPAPERPSENHGATSSDKQTSTNTSDHPAKDVVSAPDSKRIPHCEEQKTDAEKMEERREKKAQTRLNSIYVWSTVVGVIGGWIVLIVLICQTVLTRRSANAASLSALAVVTTERPWIIIFGTYDSKQGASFQAGNLGRTPAEIIGFYAEYRCVRNIKELPSVPEYGTKQVPSVTLLVPGKTLADQSIELLDSETFLDKVSGCQREPGEKFPTPPKLSVFYFRVIYRHPLSRIRPDILNYETRMCFCFSPAIPQAPNVCGPEEYNTYT